MLSFNKHLLSTYYIPAADAAVNKSTKINEIMLTAILCVRFCHHPVVELGKLRLGGMWPKSVELGLKPSSV